MKTSSITSLTTALFIALILSGCILAPSSQQAAQYPLFAAAILGDDILAPTAQQRLEKSVELLVEAIPRI